MNHKIPLLASLLVFVTLGLKFLRADDLVEVSVDPPEIRLSGPKARYSLLIHGKTADGGLIDLTRAAKYGSLQPTIASVSSAGVVHGRADGKTHITIQVQGHKKSVPVQVSASARPHAFHFENDVVPLLNRFGCNSAGCHGNAAGQNGFKLSVFGSDPAADYTALVREARGRRLLYTAPEHSLLVLKPSGALPHGGGIRIPRGSPDYDTLRDWIAAGAPFGDPAAPTVTSIRVEPRERLLPMKGQQQLRVLARWSDGRVGDVTAHAKFQSNNDGLAAVAVDGLVSAGQMPGEAAIMASFMNAVDTFRALVPRAEKIVNYPRIPENNFIDTHVFRKLKKLNIIPSELGDDAEYLRRVYLDVIGTLPTPEEARRFLADKRADRRALLVDELLKRPEFADYWALKWADALRVDRDSLGHKRAYAFYRWIRNSIAANKPLDRFAREVLTAEGPLEETGPANF